MSALGGIGQQVSGDIFELGKSVVKGVGKVAGDTISDSIEQILSAPTGVTGIEDERIRKQKEQRDKEVKDVQKKRDEKKQFQEVRGQLEEFVQRKRQQDAQIAQEKAQEEHESKQKENYEKQKKDSFLKQLMRRLAGGSHGETDRQKE